MNVLDQMLASPLGKQGKTTNNGIFEGVPTNVGAVTRTLGPLKPAGLPPISDPIDYITDTVMQPTYLDYLNSVNKR